MPKLCLVLFQTSSQQLNSTAVSGELGVPIGKFELLRPVCDLVWLDIQDWSTVKQIQAANNYTISVNLYNGNQAQAYWIGASGRIECKYSDPGQIIKRHALPYFAPGSNLERPYLFWSEPVKVRYHKNMRKSRQAVQSSLVLRINLYDGFSSRYPLSNVFIREVCVNNANRLEHYIIPAFQKGAPRSHNGAECDNCLSYLISGSSRVVCMTSIPKKILVAVDGSDGSLRAAEFAVGLASKLESELLFINVVGASTTQRDYRIPADMVGSFETMGSEMLSKCEQDAKDLGVRAMSLEVSGNPVEEILENAREAGCDCIVLGKSGLGKIEKLLMGSVSDRVTKLSDVPVIIVK